VIHQIELSQFKCFEKQKIELGELTLICGLNGMGKSTVLQSLLILRQSFNQDFLPERGLALNGDLTNLGNASDVLFSDAKNDLIEVKLKFNVDQTANWSSKCDPEKDVMTLKKKPESNLIYSTSLFTDDFQYLEAERFNPKNYYKQSDYSVIDHKQLGKQGEYTLHYLSIFGDNEVRNEQLLHPKGLSNTLRHQTEGWLTEISPRTRLSLSPIGKDLIQVRYFFVSGKYVSKDYSAPNVGFGLSSILPIIVAVLSAKPGSLIIIENPEAHLHPKGQAIIGEMLAIAAANQVQIILETHSDHVLNGIRVAVHQGKIKPENVKINFFQPDNIEKDIIRSSVTSLKIDRDGRIDHWPDGFFDQWDNSLDILLSPTKG
jgi:predicted ATPase